MIPIASNLEGMPRNNKKGEGVYVDGGGYLKILLKTHPNTDVHGFIGEHRLIAETRLGRYLRKDEEVHHIDNNQLNNADNNLAVLTKKEHAWWHGIEKTQNWEREYASSVRFLHEDTDMGAYEIADELGCSVGAVYNYLNKISAKLKGVNKVLSNEKDIALAKEMHDKGDSYKKIGNHFGVSWSTAARRIGKVSY